MSEFFLAKVSELGDSEGSGGVIIDFLEVLGENFNSVSFLVGIRELLVISKLEFFPLLDNGFIDGGIVEVLLRSDKNGSSDKEGTSQSEKQ